MEEAHIRALEARFSELADALGDLGGGDDVADLIKVIRRPGWTTPIDILLITGITESLTMQVRSLNALKGTLLEGSEMISEVAAEQHAAAVS
jgi:hypothetical protein